MLETQNAPIHAIEPQFTGSLELRPVDSDVLILSSRQEWQSEMTIMHNQNNDDRFQGLVSPEYLPTDIARKGGFLLGVLRYDSTLGRDSKIGRERTEPLTHSVNWDKIKDIKQPLDTSLLNDPNVQQYFQNRRDHVDTRTGQLVSMFPEVVAIIKSGIEVGKSSGYIPEEVDDRRIEESLYLTDIQVSDEGLIRSRRDGDYDMGTDAIKLGSPTGTVRTLAHETDHKRAGGTFKKVASGSGFKTIRTRSGFQNRTISRARGAVRYEFSHTALDEGIREHITSSIIDGEWDIIAPSKRTVDFDSCTPERSLIAELIEKSGGIIDLKTICSASFEDTTHRGTMPLRREMIRQIREAYQPATLRVFDRLCDLAVDASEADLAEMKGLIYAPEFDENGKVTKKGWIHPIKKSWEE